MSAAIIPSAQRLRIAANQLMVPPVSPVHALAMELNIFDRCTGVADQRLLTEMLGLASYRRGAFVSERGPQVAPMLAHAPARRTKTKRRG